MGQVVHTQSVIWSMEELVFNIASFGSYRFSELIISASSLYHMHHCFITVLGLTLCPSQLPVESFLN